MNEYENKIDSLLNAYEKTHPNYKFHHIFYNLSQTRNRPYDFPIEHWNKAIENAPSVCHMPVILKGFDELQERVKKQTEVLKNINESTEFLYSKYEKLNSRCDILKNNINATVQKLRNLSRIEGDFNNKNDAIERIYKLRGEICNLNRETGRVENKNTIGNILWNFKQVGEKIKKELQKFEC